MLNEQQKAFADYYIQLGNATEAAKRAGYSEKTAKQQGSRLLTNVDISAYISQRIAPIREKRIATADDVMEFLTRVMNNEEKDQFGLDASLSDRISAARELMKRHSAAKKDDDEDDKLNAYLEGMRNAKPL